MSYKALDYKKGGFKISGPCKSAARAKFDVYPSAYANAWGVRCTKAGGPGSMGKSKKKKKNGGGMDYDFDTEYGNKIYGRPSKKQSGGMFEMTKKEKDKSKVDVIKGTRTKKEEREAKKSERQTGRKVKRYKRVGERRKKSDKQGAGEVGLDRYREKLQNRAKRKRRRKARRKKVVGFGKKVAAGIKARATARRNRRRLESSRSGGGSGTCGKDGCGAYKLLGGYR